MLNAIHIGVAYVTTYYKETLTFIVGKLYNVQISWT